MAGRIIAFGMAGAGLWLVARSARQLLNPRTTSAFTSSMNFRFDRGGFEDPMSVNEAAKILGLNNVYNNPPELIKERHRILMRINHPDLGGSPLLSSKVNEAKDLLMAPHERKWKQ